MAGSEPNANANDKQGDKLHDWKPGSDPTEARHLRAPGDFGIPAMEEDSVEGRYVSRNTKMSDPGNAQARAGEDGTAPAASAQIVVARAPDLAATSIPTSPALAAAGA